MKILFLTDNFPPEVNAPANRTYEHCREWVKQGFTVTVITCVPNFPQGKVHTGYKNKLYQKEYIDGIKVIRVWSYIAANQGFIKRILDFCSFGITAFVAGLFRKTDLIIATSPQFFTPLAGSVLAFFKRKPWVMEVRDLWPESIKAVGVMTGKSPTYRFLEFLERRMYLSADQIIVVTDTFKKYIGKKKIDTRKITVVKNGVDLSKVRKDKSKNHHLLVKLGLENKFVIGYIGTHGLAHKLDFILQCASVKGLSDSFHFLFIGDGAQKSNLLRLKDKLGLKNISMCDPVPKSEVYEYISILDVALVNLRKSDTFKTVIPSKIFENAAMQKPILLGVEGESKEIIASYQAGLCFEPENQTEFISAINKLKNDKDFYSECVEGCKKLANDFDRIALANKMSNVLIQYSKKTVSSSKITKV